MVTLKDFDDPEDTVEIRELKQKLVLALNQMEAAIQKQDHAMMWAKEKEVDALTQDIFMAEEKNLKPYPATAPAPLTEEDSAFLPPEWKGFLEDDSGK